MKKFKGNTLEIKLSDKIKAISFVWKKPALYCERSMIVLWLCLLISIVFSIVTFLYVNKQATNDYYVYVIIHITTISCLFIPSAVIYNLVKRARVNNYFFLQFWTGILLIIFGFVFTCESGINIAKNFVVANKTSQLAQYYFNKDQTLYSQLITSQALLITLSVIQILTIIVLFTNTLLTNLFQEKLKIVQNIIRSNYYSRHMFIDYAKTFTNNNRPIPQFIQDEIDKKNQKTVKSRSKQRK